MDESQERRVWLDKLLHFMEERGTPISACPTISKNPLDLFRLYLYVKERGGFMEVCKVQCSSIIHSLPQSLSLYSFLLSLSYLPSS
jgi:AT-rich interactive domain-containing protein 1